MSVTTRQLKLMVRKENIRLHRKGTMAFYWVNVDGENIKLSDAEVKAYFPGQNHFFVPEENFPQK